MTNREALTAALQVTFPDTSVDKSLIDHAITGPATYTAANKVTINSIAIDLLHGLLSQPDISEGGYSIRYDRASVKARIGYLTLQNGVTGIPKVRAINVW